ncbi:hypothetical protein C4D60_Mb00t03050 [Musa balbisiana]|uniref:Uncharacterized protein n=1 Tax=Musa balbisiana TaxID=52838 RepID=A0A4S8I2W4_MUSBA|nr:hypothetical protein C4D60_Mb00t03050 [Musa balbisiana]
MELDSFLDLGFLQHSVYFPSFFEEDNQQYFQRLHRSKSGQEKSPGSPRRVVDFPLTQQWEKKRL